MNNYAIPEMNMESLEKKLTRIKNKAIKYGCEFHYTKVGEHFEEVTLSEEIGWDDYNNVPIYHHWKETVKYIDIEVEGLAAVNGWRFAASLEHTPTGNIISGVGELEIPERYYDCKPYCEHCKTNRDRRNSFIVFNESTQEFKQVGKSCLRDYTNGLSAEMVALHESFLKCAEEAHEWYGTSGGWFEGYFRVDEFMSYAAETIRIYGYAKRDGYNISTADRVEELYRKAKGMRLFESDPVAARLQDAKDKGFNAENPESVSLADAVREWVVNNEDNSNYMHNLKVACSSERVPGRNLGLLVSAFPTYNRELEHEAERRTREAQEAERVAKSSWMGEVGERISFEIAGVFAISSWETQWGTTTVYRFTSANGQEATWKTSTWVDEDKVVGGILTGTVKELKEFRGVKQTELTRCKIVRKKVEEKKKEEPGEDPREAFNLLDDLD